MSKGKNKIIKMPETQENNPRIGFKLEVFFDETTNGFSFNVTEKNIHDVMLVGLLETFKMSVMPIIKNNDNNEA